MKKLAEHIVTKKVKRKMAEAKCKECYYYKKDRERIVISGRKMEVDIEKLAKSIATNHADWPAYTGKARRVAQALPEILKQAS